MLQELERLQPMLEEDAGSASGAAQDAAQEKQEAPETKPTFDDILKDKEMQSEFDRRVQKSLETAKAKWKSEEEARVQEEKRLSKLSAEEKAAEELKAAQAKVSALEAEKDAILLKHDTLTELSSRKLPGAFADFLVSKDAESTKKNIDAFETAFRDAVNAAVSEKLKGSAPKAGAAKETDPFLAGFDS